MSDHHRHTTYSQKSAPRRKRALQLVGEFEDSGKWYRCWNCGFINNIDRNQVADSFTGGDNSQVQEYDGLTPTAFGTGDPRYAMLALGFGSIRLMQLDASGAVMTPQVSRSTKITGGCSFCGCLNYK